MFLRILLGSALAVSCASCAGSSGLDCEIRTGSDPEAQAQLCVEAAEAVSLRVETLPRPTYGDRVPVPLVRIQPVIPPGAPYPAVVLASYDVLGSGKVESVQTHQWPAGREFAVPVAAAVERWVFRHAVDSGTAYTRADVRTEFHFMAGKGSACREAASAMSPRDRTAEVIVVCEDE